MSQFGDVLLNIIFNNNIPNTNMTFAAILISGPTHPNDLRFEEYYSYYYPLQETLPIESWQERWLSQLQMLHVHIEFMTQLLSSEFMMHFRSLNAASLNKGEEEELIILAGNILTMCIQKVVPRAEFPKKKNMKQRALSLLSSSFDYKYFIHRFFSWFNFYLNCIRQEHLQQISSRNKFKSRSSHVWNQLKNSNNTVLPPNQIADTIPSQGLYQSASAHIPNSFSDWITEMNGGQWLDAEPPVNGSTTIFTTLDLISETQNLILMWNYDEFTRHICTSFNLPSCTLHTPTLNLQHPKQEDRHLNDTYIPLQQRVHALTDFEHLVDTRLHKIQEESTHSMPQQQQTNDTSYMNNNNNENIFNALYRQGKQEHEKSEDLETNSYVQCFNKDNSNTEKQSFFQKLFRKKLSDEMIQRQKSEQVQNCYSKSIQHSIENWQNRSNAHFTYDLDQDLRTKSVNQWETF